MEQGTVELTAEIEERYWIENQIMFLAAAGDAAGLKEIMAKMAGKFDFPNRGKDELRRRKNLMIVLNTLFRKAVENGGVHPIHIHAVSERFALAIERTRSLQVLQQIPVLMAEEYCALSRIKAGKGYSPLVSRCVEYLKLRYAEAISVAELAAVLGTSPSYLCRRFKQETGTTMGDYANRQRIEAAKRLLPGNRLGLAEIALRVGFRDANYFGRVFKKYGGCPPSRYRGE